MGAALQVFSHFFPGAVQRQQRVLEMGCTQAELGKHALVLAKLTVPLRHSTEPAFSDYTGSFIC